MHPMPSNTPPTPPPFRYPPAGAPTYRFRWRTRKQHPERFGNACRIVPAGDPGRRGPMGMVVVEFEDGARAVTTRGSIRLKTRSVPAKPWPER